MLPTPPPFLTLLSPSRRSFEQETPATQVVGDQTINLLPKDNYKIMCDQCDDGKGYVKGLTSVEDVPTATSANPTPKCPATDSRPGMCYDKSTGFASCPSFPSADSNSFTEFLPSSMSAQKCKYAYRDAWDTTDSGDFSKFNSTCKTYELCAVEEDDFTKALTYKVACKECANNYLPAFPVKPSGAGSMNMGTCSEDWYPSDCYQHTFPVTTWDLCPSSEYQDVQCNYWINDAWVNKQTGSSSPWSGTCGNYELCHYDIASSEEFDQYWLVCVAPAERFTPSNLAKPTGSLGACSDKFVYNSVALIPTPSPTTSPTEEYRPPPSDGGGGDSTDPDDSTDDTYVPPTDNGGGQDQSFERPTGIVDKMREALGPMGEHTEIILGGAIAMCVLCGFCMMKNGCKCCGSVVEYDSDKDEDEYGFSDDSSEYTDGTYDTRDTRSSRASSTSSSASAFEEYDNPMNKSRGGAPKGMRIDSNGLLAADSGKKR